MEIARRELRPGEKLIWADQPKASALAKQHRMRFLFAIPFTAFACVWIWGASQAAGDGVMATVFPFFGLPFLTVGLWMLLAPLRAWRAARATVYGITDQRLFISSGTRRRRVESYGPQDITKVEREELDGGTGSIVFAEEHTRFRTKRGWRERVEDIGFFGIAQVRDVEAEIVKLRARGEAATTASTV